MNFTFQGPTPFVLLEQYAGSHHPDTATMDVSLTLADIRLLVKAKALTFEAIVARLGMEDAEDWNTHDELTFGMWRKAIEDELGRTLLK